MKKIDTTVMKRGTLMYYQFFGTRGILLLEKAYEIPIETKGFLQDTC